jgi:hypothetical protein
VNNRYLCGLSGFSRHFSKDDIKKGIGRLPDCTDALLLALWQDENKQKWMTTSPGRTGGIPGLQPTDANGFGGTTTSTTAAAEWPE